MQDYTPLIYSTIFEQSLIVYNKKFERPHLNNPPVRNEQLSITADVCYGHVLTFDLTKIKPFIIQAVLRRARNDPVCGAQLHVAPRQHSYLRRC